MKGDCEAMEKGRSWMSDDERKLSEYLCALSGTDFTSLMLEVFRKRAENLADRDLLLAFSSTRFTQPASVDPVTYHLLQAELLKKGREHGFAPTLLSPLAPFGSSSAFGCVNQNKIMSTVRGAEVLADPTNVLAVLAALGIRNGEISLKETHHFCATAQVTRAQSHIPKGALTHFGLLGLVSEGVDTGSYSCEKDMLLCHLRFYESLLGDAGSVVLHRRSGYPDENGFWNRMVEFLSGGVLRIPVTVGESKEDNGYYRGISFKIYGNIEGTKKEIADGGFVDWMNRMTGIRKLRCFISGAGLERLMLFINL